MDKSAQFTLITKRILRELTLLMETVRAGFLGVEKQVRSISDQQKTANQHQQQDRNRSPILHAELQIPEAVQGQQRNNDNRQFGVQLALAIVTFLAFVAAAIYAGINYKMLCEMRAANKTASDSFAKTLCQMKAQTAAQQTTAGNSASTLTAITHNFEIDQRPYVVPLSQSFLQIQLILVRPAPILRSGT